jgi:HK97 family phage major capsid protein/HK97 family phage prohead protease
MSQKTIKVSSMTRSMGAAFDVDENNATTEFPFSSELAVERYFGDEILSHDANSADLTRLNDSAPLLWNHDPDQVIGVVEGARIGGDRRGYAKVRFGTSPKAQEILADVRAGILRNVSFGYRILEMTEQRGNSKPTFKATRWAPLEISVVSIPADHTVGLGRASGDDEVDVPVLNIEGEKMSDSTVPATPVDVSAVRAEAVSAERSRIANIAALGEKFGKADLARQLVEGGKSLEEARAAFLDVMGVRQAQPVASGDSGAVDMSDSEQRDFSVVRAINASISRDWSGAGLEREVSRTLAKQLGRDTEGFFMPLNLRMSTRAPYAVGAAGTGGNIVATNLMADQFIDVLRNKALVMSLGPTVMSGLVGNVAIPRQITQTQTYWVTEASAITEAEATFDQVTLSPKQLGARSQYSRLMLQQSTPDIEAIVRNDLARVMALGMDLAMISGSGSSGQPRGVLNTSGIGSVAMGTNGLQLANLDPFIDLEKAVDVANALNGNLYYLTNSKVVAAAKKLKDGQNLPLWTADHDNTTAGTAGLINGYPVARSNQVPSNLTKGTGTNLSACLFGDWSQLVVGLWGGLEILPNPYGSGYNAGSVDIRAMQTCDLAVRHAESFAAITDIVA